METTAWQTKFSCFKERHLYAYNNSLFCDVELSVMDANGDKVTIPAHKYVLAISSPVFEAMFYGKLAETGRTIDLPGCTKEGLQEMLRYVYSDKVNFTGSNVLAFLYLAEKYVLPFLKGKCEEYLKTKIKPEEVFHVLPQIRSKKVEKRCWDMVDSDTERAVSSASFLNISKEMLCKLLVRDDLSIDEVDLFDAVGKWALKKLKEEGLEENRKNMRAVLGEDVIKLIRFPLMSLKEFATKVLPSGVLKMDEVTELIQLFSNLESSKCDTIIKGSCITISRFNSISLPHSRGGWWSCGGVPDAIDFKTNKNIFLTGIRFFGSIDSTYNVTLALYSSGQKIKELSSKMKTDSEETKGYYGFTITFAESVAIKANVVYTIEAIISGPTSYFGEDGKPTVEVNGIEVTYMQSKKTKNGTSINQGQFPTLIFRNKLKEDRPKRSSKAVP